MNSLQQQAHLGEFNIERPHDALDMKYYIRWPILFIHRAAGDGIWASMSVTFWSHYAGTSAWTCCGLIPGTYLIYAADLSNVRRFLPLSVGRLRRGL